MWKVQEQLQHLALALANAEVGVELLNFTVTTAPVVSARINSSESREKRGNVLQSRHRGCAHLCRRWYIAGVCETGGRIILLGLNKNGFREIILYFFEAFLPPQLQMREGTAIPAVAPRILSGRGARCPCALPGTEPEPEHPPAGTDGPGGTALAMSHPAAGGRIWGRVSASLQRCCGCNLKTKAKGLASSYIF